MLARGVVAYLSENSRARSNMARPRFISEHVAVSRGSSRRSVSSSSGVHGFRSPRADDALDAPRNARSGGSACCDEHPLRLAEREKARPGRSGDRAATSRRSHRRLVSQEHVSPTPAMSSGRAPSISTKATAFTHSSASRRRASDSKMRVSRASTSTDQSLRHRMPRPLSRSTRRRAVRTSAVSDAARRDSTRSLKRTQVAHYRAVCASFSCSSKATRTRRPRQWRRSPSSNGAISTSTPRLTPKRCGLDGAPSRGFLAREHVKEASIASASVFYPAS